MEKFHNFIRENEDPRTREFFLTQSIAPVLMITLIYLLFVNVLLPKFMKNRKPFILKKVLLFYNLFQVVFNGYIFFLYSKLWINDYNWRCEPLIRYTTPREIPIVTATHLFFLSKIPELLDTVFFILRKKNDQVSMLHVIHHGIMPSIGWLSIKCFPTGNI
jgi:elongation of very long chain fatty acids protein 7